MVDFPSSLTRAVESRIRDVPDFPKPGIIFKDLTPVFGHGPTYRSMIEAFAERYRKMEIDAFIGIEARGFLTAAPVAVQLETALHLLRKRGKLPWRTVSETYELEYGTDALEMHEDAVRPGQRVVVMDDLLATGGTMGAAVELLRGQGAQVVEACVVVELAFLGGREKIREIPCTSLVSIQG